MMRRKSISHAVGRGGPTVPQRVSAKLARLRRWRREDEGPRQASVPPLWLSARHRLAHTPDLRTEWSERQKALMLSDEVGLQRLVMASQLTDLAIALAGDDPLAKDVCLQFASAFWRNSGPEAGSVVVR